MSGLLIVSALAVLAAALVIAARLHINRDFEHLVQAIRRLGNATRTSLEKIAKAPEPPKMKNWSDLAIFLWNSRLFVQMGNQVVVSAPQNKEVKLVSEDIVTHHKNLRKLVVLSVAEKAMGILLMMRASFYQNEAVACYAESENLIYYLISNWRPQDEGVLGDRL